MKEVIWTSLTVLAIVGLATYTRQPEFLELLTPLGLILLARWLR